jgi:hypothetical protein
VPWKGTLHYYAGAFPAFPTPVPPV